MIPLISLATHFKPGCNPSLIDNILTNSSENIQSAGVFESGVSHHRPIFCFIKDETPKIENSSNRDPKYDYCESNMNKFECDMEQMHQTNANLDYTEANFIAYVNEIKLKIENIFLIKSESKSTSKRTILCNPWITPGVIASVNKKHFLYAQWRKSVTKVNKLGSLELYNIFKIYRKQLKGIIKHAKRSYYSKKFDNAKGNMKKTWALINELRGKTKNSIKSCFKIHGNLIEDKREIANGFNNFFSSIARNMNVKLHSSCMLHKSPKFTDYLDKRVCSSIFLYQCNRSEVCEIIKEFQSDKASDISVRVLKRVAVHVAEHLSGFINKFMELGTFPKSLKIGKISPIHKKGDVQLLDNYRPISVLPIFGKIFEKILYNRLYSFFTSKSVIYKKQFGFRKKHSTGHAINYSINKIIDELQTRNHVIGIFIDLSKAFDTIDHNKLVSKLEHYGIRGTCLALFKKLPYRPAAVYKF